MSSIIVTVSGGIAEVQGSAFADVTIIDFDSEDVNDWDYDKVSAFITEVLDSDMDGPEQMALISRICHKFIAESK